ncbi:serine hydrolase domain-containing protein [Ensifer sp. MJa1]|uniref:serine hydrolase domain-containing protein n=1 Tax=Ensifer sp. MJa1 TaxID=2919888 RepID=UPI003009369A
MTGKTAFSERYGFGRDQVTLANWRTAPFSRWAFQNVGELVPSAPVMGATVGAVEEARDLSGLLSERVALPSGQTRIGDFLERSYADALAVMKGGTFIGDWVAPTMQFGEKHIAFSISKSMVAIIAGILQDEGLLHPDAPVIDYLPETAGSAYADATVRHVLDMTVSLDIEEAYLDPDSAFGRYRRAMLWNPGGGGEGLFEFLCTLKRLPTPHGEVFRYRSPNTDLLGILLERVSGRRIADLMRERLWAPLGTTGEIAITVDREGTSRASAGISLTPRDLARVGEMMRNGGIANGRRIVSQGWVSDTLNNGSHEAWQRSDFAPLFPKGRYRNKWYQTGEGSFCGIGIHGQWLFVDPENEVVVVRMSCQPEPLMEALDYDNLAFMKALAKMV